MADRRPRDTRSARALSAARSRGPRAALAAILLAGCTLERRGDHTVTIAERHFAPTELRVPRGARVAWHNTSILVHAVSTDPVGAPASVAATLPTGAAPLRSGDVSPGRIWSYTLTQPGRYAYYCPYHREDGMIGTIVVVDE